MKKRNRLFAALLAFAVLLGAAPFTLAPRAAAADAAAADAAVGPNDPAFDSDNDGSPDLSLVNLMTGVHKDQTLKQVKDVYVSASTKLTVRSGENLVSSTLDGNGHTITLGDGVEYVAQDGAARLTYGIINGIASTIQNIVIRLEGRVVIIRNSLNNLNLIYNTIYAGVLAGFLSDCTVQNCAVLAAPGSGPARLEVRLGLNPTWTIVGSLVGKAELGSRLDGCYSDVDVQVALYKNYFSNSKLHLGGIVGELGSTGTVLRNAAYYGKEISYYGVDPRAGATFGYLGGLVGVRANEAGIENSYVNTPLLRFRDIDERRTSVETVLNPVVQMSDYTSVPSGHGYAGWVHGNGYAGYTNVFARINVELNTAANPDTASVWGGNAAAPSSATAAKLGSVWAQAGGYVNLAWLVAGGAPKVAVDGTWPPTAAITPDPPAGNEWQFDVSLPVKGQMPTALAPTGISGVPAGEAVTGITLERHVTTGDAAVAYVGQECQFSATLEGVSSVAGKAVDWSAAYGATELTVADGRFTVPAGAEGGTIEVAAASDGFESVKFSLAVEAAPASGMQHDKTITDPVRPGKTGGTGSGMTYTLSFGDHRVDGADARYSYELTKADGTGSLGKGVIVPGKETIVFTADAATVASGKVLLKLTVQGGDTRKPSGDLTYEIPLSAWGPGVGPAIKSGTASAGSAAGTRTASKVKYVPDTAVAPSTDPTRMDLSQITFSGGKITQEDLAQGDIRITSVRLRDVPYNPRNSKYFVAAGSGNAGTGGRTAAPTIHPRPTGIIGREGITIAPGEADSKIYYTTATGGAAPPDPDPEKVGGTNPTKLYEGGIDYPLGEEMFAVKAIAVAGTKSASSADLVEYTRAANLAAPDAPGLKLGDSSYEPGVTYPARSAIHFTHPNLADGTVYYTIDGRIPTEGGGDAYKPDEPVLLPDNRQTVTIQAFFKHNTSQKSSVTASFTVQIRQRIAGPVASLPSNSAVANGTSLQLSVSDAALGQLDANFGTDAAFLRRVVYRDGASGVPQGLYDLDGNRLGGLEMQDSGSEAGQTIRLDAASDPPIDGMQYINCVADVDTFTMPELRHLLGEGDPAKDGSTYGYALRMVVRSMETSTVSYTVRYRNPPELVLTGEPEEKIKVRAVVMTPSVKFDDSATADFVYPLRGRAAAPTAYPPTAQDNPAVVRPGETIRLTSQTAGAKIYYTLDNTEPRVDDAGSPIGASTLLYDEAAGIVMDKNAVSFMTIWAVAWKDGYDLSKAELFRYQLPAAVLPVLATPNGGALVEGSQITLASTTAGATIYYTTDGKPVEPGKSQIYTGPITVTKDVTIRAAAEKEGMVSTETKYDFTLARKLGAPSASLASGAVVYKGTRVYLNGSGTVAYTVDGSDPKAILTGSVGKDDQVLYGNSVVLDADFGKSVTVRAFCYRSGNTPSETASFTYTVCEEGDYLMAVPESGGTITPGADITLTTSLTGGKIFYSVGSSSPELRNRYDSSDNIDDGDYDDWYDGYPYRWAAKTGTKEGGTVTASGEPGSTFIIRATAVADGSQGGTTKVFTYKFVERTPAPTASIPSGAITLNGASVKLTVKEGDIFYTTDGSDPTTSSALYTGPIAVGGSMVLKAVAVGEGKEPSEIVQYVYTHAGQTAAPVMSVPGGEIEQGTRVELSTQTPGAVIYYTTDGTEPTAQSMAYTSPITVMRPITLKAKAMLEGLHESVVNSATYTVFEPQKPDPGEETGKPQRVETDRLTTRRTYSDDTAGPAFTEVVLVDPQYQAVLSSPAGVAPPDASLIVRAVEPTAKERQAVSAQTGYAIASAYDVSVERGGETVVLSGTTELGLPIPPEYQNGVVTICRMGDDGSIEPLDTRRSGGVAYAMEGRPARYAIAVPDSSAGGSGGSPLPWAVGGGVLAIAGAVALALHFRKKSGRAAE